MIAPEGEQQLAENISDALPEAYVLRKDLIRQRVSSHEGLSPLSDYLISFDSYVHAGVCVGSRSHRHDADSLE